VKSVFISLLLLVVLYGCQTNLPPAINGLLNEQNLTSQFFTVNINADTTLLTKNGCVIKIPKDAITSSNNMVKLEIKEALNNTDIVMAGLTTMSGKLPLSSGGMIYFNAADGYNIEIKKQIEVLIPTGSYNRDMQVFKGDTVNGKIDWQAPEALPQDSTTEKVDAGKALFLSNCASCHKVDKDFTGPALGRITKNYSWDWVYALTIHDQHTLNGACEGEGADAYTSKLSDSVLLKPWSDNDYEHGLKLCLHHKCINHKYSGAEMPSFSMLKEKDIKNIYAYIESEKAKLPPPTPSTNQVDCCDSCVEYVYADWGLKVQREKLKEDNGQFFNLDRVIPVPPQDTTIYEVDTTTILTPPYTKVTPTSVQATYYTINIKAVGWYNIDILMKDYNNCVESELFVRLKENYNFDVNINLIIPQYKAFVEGGKLKDGTQYGFDENDGKIKLPRNTKAYIIAFAEKDDKLIFAKKEFNTQTKQTIELVFTEISKQQLKAEITALKLDNVEAEVKDSKNAAEIRAIDKKINAAESIKPKNCNCDFLIPSQSPVKADSVK
jgi:mono/diheme cytochrome c family protein